MIKLIASDLDGTIIDSKHVIPEDNLKAIKNLKKANIPFVVCTGKTYSISKDICKSLNASFGIFGNGGQIINLSTGDTPIGNSTHSAVNYFALSTRPWRPPICFLSLWIYLFSIFQIKGVIQCETFVSGIFHRACS